MSAVKELTGRKVLTILLVAFGVILTANMTLLYYALHSFPGLEEKNPYIASQSFDTRAAAQVALGWVPHVEYGAAQVKLQIMGAQGGLVFPKTLTTRIGRPTHDREDQVVVFQKAADGYYLDAKLARGKWFVYVTAQSADGVDYTARLAIYVTDKNG
ncbi:MAG: FixH family protein [Paracoccaceae bacterium]